VVAQKFVTEAIHVGISAEVFGGHLPPAFCHGLLRIGLMATVDEVNRPFKQRG
jgi:hypothetical protein